MALTPKCMASPGSEMEKGCVCSRGRSLTPGQGWGQPDTCGLSTNPAGSCPTAACTAGLLGPGTSQAPSDPQGNAVGTHREISVHWACTSTVALKQAWKNAPKEEASPLTAQGQMDRQIPGTGIDAGAQACPAAAWLPLLL